MCLLAKQSYIKIRREVDLTKQKNIEDKRTIYMYQDKIITKYRKFLMKDVTDISFRKIKRTGEIGFLYIHTISGLYSYTVKASPHNFIKVFKNHKNSVKYDTE